MDYLKDELDTHFEEQVIPNILNFQASPVESDVPFVEDSNESSTCIQHEAEAFVSHVCEKLHGVKKARVSHLEYIITPILILVSLLCTLS